MLGEEGRRPAQVRDRVVTLLGFCPASQGSEGAADGRLDGPLQDIDASQDPGASELDGRVLVALAPRQALQQQGRARLASPRAA